MCKAMETTQIARKMANRTKSTAAAAPPVAPSSHLSVVNQTGETQEAALAKLVTRPTVQAAITANMLLGPQFKEQDLNELILALSNQVTTAHDGDLSRAEAMLVSQAQTLDLLFNKLTRQAVGNIGSYPDTVALYLKLALRAQSQCRAVAETLNEMKHPKPVAFFQQANISHGGAQQINNGRTPPAEGSRAGEIVKPQNKLLEATAHGEQLDGRTAQSAAAGDSHMEAVDECPRATVRSR